MYAQNLVPESGGANSEGSRKLCRQATILLRRSGRNHQSKARRSGGHSQGKALPVHSAGADELRTDRGNSFWREQGGNMDHVYLARGIAAGDDHHSHGTWPDDGRGPQSQYGVGGLVGGLLSVGRKSP